MSEENASKSEIYRFGDCVLDADRRELSRSGEPVTMQPKAFDLLLFLVRNRNRAIDKDELQDILWPRSIVTETALTRCVMKARRAVGDDADRQHVIKTVHGHGYRFVADLVPGQSPGPANSDSRTDPVSPLPVRRHQPRRWAGIVAVLGIASLAIWWVLSPPAIGSEARLAVLPVENATGDEDLGWVRTGMMSLMNRMLEAKGIAVVGEREIIDLAGNAALEELTRPDSEFAVALAETTAPTHRLAAVLEQDGDLYRLSFSLVGTGLREQRRAVVGREPAKLVKEAVDTVAGILTLGAPSDEHLREISADDFLNEAYARAMSLQFEGNYEEAKRFFQVIIEQDPELFWPRYEYALCVRNLRDWDNAERLLTTLVDEVTQQGRIDLQTVASNGLGILYMNQRRNEEAVRTFERVEAFALEADKPMYVVTANVNLGIVTRNMGDINRAAAHLDKAYEALQRMDLQSYPGTFHNTYAGILIRTGDLAAAEAHALKAIDNFRLTGKRLFAAYAQSRLSTIYRATGRYDEARELAEQSLAVRKEFNDQSGVASSLMALSEIGMAVGDITRARQYAQQVFDIGVATDDADARAMAIAQIAEADRLSGRTRESIEGYQSAESLYRNLDDPLGVANAQAGLARASIDLGDLDGAGVIAQNLLQAAREREHDTEEARALNLVGEVMLARERFGDAVDAFLEALAITLRIGDGPLAFAARANLTHALLEQGDTDDAQPHLDAVTLERPEHPDVLRLQAHLAWARGDAQAAAASMAQARSLAGESWNARDAAELERYREAASGE